MTLQQAIEKVKDGEAERLKEAGRIAEAANWERDLERKKVDKEKAEFVAKWFPPMREYLDNQIEAAAKAGTPSASCDLLNVSPEMAEPNGEHEIALVTVMKVHYECAGFTVRWWHPSQDRWGAIQVSGWMESPCG